MDTFFITTAEGQEKRIQGFGGETWGIKTTCKTRA